MPQKTIRVPLATDFLNRDATLTKDSRLINCYIEKYHDGRTAIVKRPGITSYQELGSGMGQGITNHVCNLVTVQNNKVYSTNLTLGYQDIATSNEPVQFEVLDIQNVATNLIIKGTGCAYYWDGISSSLTQITDPDYPASTVAGVVHLDGYIFVMDSNGVISNSDLQRIPDWNPLNYIQAEVEPDNGVAIAKYLNYLVAFGRYSTEFFYDAANPIGSPLARIDNAFSPIGCANGNSVVGMDTSIIWVSQTKEDNAKVGRGREITMLSGMAPKKISTPFIDRILANDSLANVRAHSFKNNGHDFYVLTLIDSQITLVFDVTIGVWVQWTGYPVKENFIASSCLSTATPAGISFVSSQTSGSYPSSIAIQGGYLYIADYISGNISVYSIANPATPVLISSIHSHDGITGMVVKGNYAYVTSLYFYDFKIFDLRNPVNLVLISSTSTIEKPIDIKVENNIAYVLTSNHLRIFDVTAPGIPVVLGSVGVTGTTSALAVVNKMVYIITNDVSSYLYIYNATTSTSPVLSGTLLTAYPNADLVVKDNYAYVIGTTYLGVYDISGTNPVLKYSTTTVGSADLFGGSTISLEGDYLYIAGDFTGKVSAINIKNPISPIISAQYSGGYQTIAEASGYMYLTNLNTALLSVLKFYAGEPAGCSTIVATGTPNIATKFCSLVGNLIQYGSYTQFKLIDNKYIVTFQLNVAGSATTVIIYDLLYRQIRTFQVTEILSHSIYGTGINQNYNNGIAYFNVTSGSSTAILKINIYDGTYSIITPTVPTGHTLVRISNVDPTGQYVLMEATKTSDSSVDIYRVDITTTVPTFLLITNIASANIPVTTTGVGSFIYSSNIYVLYKGASLLLYKYLLTDGSVVSNTSINADVTAFIVNADVQSGYIAIQGGFTSSISIYNLLTSTMLITGLPYGIYSFAPATSFVLVDTTNNWIFINVSGNIYTYNFTGVLLRYTGNTSIYGDTPAISAFMSHNETFYSPSFHTSLGGIDYLLDYNTGTIWKSSEFYYLDGTNNINARIITPNLDFGSNHIKFVSELEFIGDKVNGTMNVSYSNNDYVSWIPYRQASLGNQRARLHRLGKARRRAYEFYYTDPTALRLEAFDLIMDGERD